MIKEKFYHNGFQYEEVKDKEYILKKGDLFLSSNKIEDLRNLEKVMAFAEKSFRYRIKYNKLSRLWTRCEPKNPLDMPPYPYGW